MDSTMIYCVFIVLALWLFMSTVIAVPEGQVYVTTVFGKFNRILHPGLTFKLPFFERIQKRISIQNLSNELAFQAITIDQANVYFKTLLIYSVLNDDTETIRNVAFKFISEQNFSQSLFRSIEGTIRSFVATKKQEEVLILREEIVKHVKEQLDVTLAEWGYRLLDLQINEIKFDEAIIKSMAEVVASNNLLQAAHNQGESIRIIKVKEAEAEREASKLRGQGRHYSAKRSHAAFPKRLKKSNRRILTRRLFYFRCGLSRCGTLRRKGKAI